MNILKSLHDNMKALLGLYTADDIRRALDAVEAESQRAPLSGVWFERVDYEVPSGGPAGAFDSYEPNPERDRGLHASPRTLEGEPTGANNITSLTRPAYQSVPRPPGSQFRAHKIVLDIDVPCRLIESTTPGHFHLYIDRVIDEADYFELLDILAKAGVLEPGYVAASKRRGHTSLRLPWVRKGRHAEVSAP